ncbi:MAG: hypothetical protein LQ343_002797 [Gyalolechia ehrenbergii]|nr:MAG: hypothetical protein LQ343_002797 [Gyalolechia ehrenbergii]
MINEGDDASIQKYLAWDLTLPWLNDIHDHLWLAGRPMSARSLHRQAMLGRAMVITEQVDLHMVRQDGRIFLKPLPDYLLSYDFWIQALLSSINAESLDLVNKRYHYGELRLARLNWIYRLFSRHTNITTVVRGYMYGYHQYSDILRRNFAWVLITLVYVSTVLAALQVALATETLRTSNAFQQTSYGFAVFSILIPLVTFAVIIVNLLALAFFNVTATVSFKRKTDRARNAAVAVENQQTV